MYQEDLVASVTDLLMNLDVLQAFREMLGKKNPAREARILQLLEPHILCDY